jgi:hypothetical protein
VTARTGGRALAGVALVLAGAAAVSFLALRQALRLRGTWPPEADTFYLPSSQTMRVASLGHHELTSDLVAARANVYFGTQLLSKGQQRYLAEYLSRAVDLDPYFRRLYLSGAAMEIYNGKNPELATMLAATALLERGTTMFPLDWELWFQLGFSYFFELPKLAPASDERAKLWRQRGVEMLRRAALFEGIPDWLPSLVAGMLTKSGSDKMAIRHLEQAYAVATSDEARLQIRFKLNQLRGQQITRELEGEYHRFEEMLESRYPYAPEAFSVAAGPRQPRAVELPPAPAAGAKPGDERRP